MPAKSKAQQKAAGAALAAKRGDQKVSELKGASKSMYESMTEEQLEDFASTKRSRPAIAKLEFEQVAPPMPAPHPNPLPAGGEREGPARSVGG